MKMTFHPSRYRVFCVLTLAAGFAGPLCAHSDSPSEAISMSEMGAKATGEYKGQSTGFAAKAGEAELRMAFQKIGGTATRKGQRFVSTEAAGVIAVSDISTGEDRSPAFSAGLSSGRISA